jgi:hypothetical protein
MWIVVTKLIKIIRYSPNFRRGATPDGVPLRRFAARERAVFAAYGWPEGIDDEEILKNLLALNLERSARG